MDLGDIFGPKPQRPSHPDFWRLSSILLKLDGRVEAAPTQDEKDKVWEDNVTRWIDDNSLNYAASQRAMRALGVITVGDAQRNLEPLIKLSVMWQEGFQIGAEFTAEPIQSQAIHELDETALRLLLSNYERHVLEVSDKGEKPMTVVEFFDSFFKN